MVARGSVCSVYDDDESTRGWGNVRRQGVRSSRVPEVRAGPCPPEPLLVSVSRRLDSCWLVDGCQIRLRLGIPWPAPSLLPPSRCPLPPDQLPCTGLSDLQTLPYWSPPHWAHNILVEIEVFGDCVGDIVRAHARWRREIYCHLLQFRESVLPGFFHCRASDSEREVILGYGADSHLFIWETPYKFEVVCVPGSLLEDFVLCPVQGPVCPGIPIGLFWGSISRVP